MRMNFRGVVLSLSLLLVGRDAVADFGQATVIGRIMCIDGGNPPFPLDHVRIDVLVSHSSFGTRIGDYSIGQGHTDDQGRFNFEVRDFNDRPWGNQIYAQVVLNDDQGVRLITPDQYFTDWFADSPGLLDDGTGTFNYGTQVVGTSVPGIPAVCAVWANARSALQEYLGVTGGIPPPAGSYVVRFWSAVTAGTPWSDTTSTNWPTNVAADITTARHEFAHTVRHRFDGEEAHFAGDVVTYNYPRMHDHCLDSGNFGFSFNEGWAEFWSGEAGACRDRNNMQIEGNNAAVLAQLAACPGVGRRGLLSVLNLNPATNAGGIHSIVQLSSDVTTAFPSCVVAGLPPPAGGCDVGGPGTGTTHGPPPLVPVEQVRTSAQARLQELDRAIAELERALPWASSAAKSPPPCDEKNCAAAVAAILGPPEIDATLKQAKLVRSRLADEVAGLDTNPHGLNGNGCARGADFYRWFQEDQLAFRGQLVAIASEALKQESTALAPLRGQSPYAAKIIEVLDAELTSLMAAPNAPLPPQLQLPPSMLGERLHAPSPPLAPRARGCACQVSESGSTPLSPWLLLCASLLSWWACRPRSRRQPPRV